MVQKIFFENKRVKIRRSCIEIESCQFTNIDIIETENLVYY